MGRKKAEAYLGFLIVAGFLTSLVAELVLCLWHVHSPSLRVAFAVAFVYVSCAVLSGAAATWFFWSPSRMSPSSPLSLFALTSAVGWIWVPSIVLLSRQRSIGAVLLAVMGAAIMASGLRRILASHHQNVPGWKSQGRELFAQSLLNPPREGHAFIIALCIYAAFFALHKHATLAASILLALSAFLLAWKLTLAREYAPENEATKSRAALRLGREASTAVLITMAVILLGFQPGIGSNAMEAASAAARGSANRAPREKNQVVNANSTILGYESIILWPVPEKKKILAPSSPIASSQEVRMTKPLVIRFDGPYWYLRPPRRSPGSRAHVVRGTPLAVNIHSSDFIPLLMEARQSLGSAIQLTSCREIQVTIENHDNIPGRIALGVLLTDSTSIGKPTLYLDQQPVISAEPDHFSVKSSPVEEVLRFAVPNHPRIDRFDEITVFFFPDTERARTGAKISIQEFQLIPR